MQNLYLQIEYKTSKYSVEGQVSVSLQSTS